MRPLVGGALLSVVGKAFGTGSSSTGVCSLPAFLQRLAWRPSPFSDRTRSFDRIFISPPALRRLFYRVRAIRVPMLPLHSWRGRSRTLRRDAPPPRLGGNSQRLSGLGFNGDFTWWSRFRHDQLQHAVLQRRRHLPSIHRRGQINYPHNLI